MWTHDTVHHRHSTDETTSITAPRVSTYFAGHGMGMAVPSMHSLHALVLAADIFHGYIVVQGANQGIL